MTIWYFRNVLFLKFILNFYEKVKNIGFGNPIPFDFRAGDDKFILKKPLKIKMQEKCSATTSTTRLNRSPNRWLRSRRCREPWKGSPKRRGSGSTGMATSITKYIFGYSNLFFDKIIYVVIIGGDRKTLPKFAYSHFKLESYRTIFFLLTRWLKEKFFFIKEPAWKNSYTTSGNSSFSVISFHQENVWWVV